MTEHDWHSSDNPEAMLDFLLERGQAPAGSCGGRISLRKLRLFTVATLRYVFGRGDPPTTDDQLVALDALERLADDKDEDGLFDAVTRANIPRPGIALGTVAGSRMHAQMVSQYPMPDVRRHECFLLHCIAGNPSRPWVREIDDGLLSVGMAEQRGLQVIRHRWLVHNDGSVPKLARVIYDERRGDLLPILADALEEAGCVGTDPCPHCGGKGYHETGLVRCDFHGIHDSREKVRCVACSDGTVPHPLVVHCRGPGPHARGCHAVDLLLGLE